MSDRFYQTIENISKSYSRPVLIIIYVASIFILGLGLHLLSLFITDFIDDKWDNYFLLVEKIIIITSFFSMMWYYHKSRYLLIDHARHENQLQMFIKYTPAPVAMVDKNMCYIAASDRWLQNFHVTDKNIVGKSHYDVFSDLPDMARWKKDHQYCLAGGKIHCNEDRFIGLDGKEEWLTYDILPWYESDNQPGGLIFLVEFITSRIETMRKLQQSEARFSRILRGSNDGIFDWDVPNNTVYFSPRFKKFLGYEEEEIANSYEGFNALLHPDDVERIRLRVEDHLYKGKPYEVEYRLRKKTGEYIWIEARGQTEWTMDGRPSYFSGTMVDISERKRLEELRKEFVYVVTHELRTPLSSLRGALDMLPIILGADLPKLAEKSIDLAMQGCERLTSLVNDLLEVGKAETAQLNYLLEPKSLNDLLHLTVELNMAYAKKYGVTYDLQKDLPAGNLLLDEGRFHQIMANLISNAVKFSPHGAIVKINAIKQGSDVIISVKDHGKGISKEFCKKIFQKFARDQNNVPGTGLGLNITKTMVEKMNGKIWFETEENIGTTFFVSFPLV